MGFHFGRLPFWLSSILVVFHFGRLPFWSSSILVVFHFGLLPFWSSSILVPCRIAQRFYPPAQLNGPIFPHSSTVLTVLPPPIWWPNTQLQKGGPQIHTHTYTHGIGSLLKLTSLYAGKLENRREKNFFPT